LLSYQLTCLLPIIYSFNSSRLIQLELSLSICFIILIVYFLSSGTPTPRHRALSSLMVILPDFSLSYCLNIFLTPFSKSIVGGIFCRIPAFMRIKQLLMVALSPSLNTSFSSIIYVDASISTK